MVCSTNDGATREQAASGLKVDINSGAMSALCLRRKPQQGRLQCSVRSVVAGLGGGLLRKCFPVLFEKNDVRKVLFSQIWHVIGGLRSFQ